MGRNDNRVQGDPDERVEKMAQEAIEEARMVLPGIQALFGFQLIAVFNNANAIFSATGVRIRDLPLNPARIKQAIGV